MSTTLPLFWDLSAASKQKRLKASSELITALERFQLGFEAQPSPVESDDADMDGVAAAAEADSDEGDDDEDDDESGEEVDDSDADDEPEVDPKEARRLDKELDRQNSEDVRYSIRRLIRGLASSRESSRLGFAVALTELLSRLDTITPKQIISIVLRFSHITVSIQRQEVRDLLFARLFGLTSVVQSQLLYRPAATLADFQTVLTQLVAVGARKSWLRESCWWAVYSALQGLEGKDLAWRDEAVRWLAEFVFTGEEGKEWTAEKVALAVKMQQAYPTLAWKSLLAPTFKHASVLHPANLPTLAKILRDTAVTSDEDDDDDDEPTAGPSSANPGTGSWKPNPPFVWDLILDIYFPPGTDAAESSTAKDRASFSDFYRVAVDESLFDVKASPERKYWGFQIFIKALPRLPSTEIPLIFTPNFMRVWINNLSGEERYLHKAALAIAQLVQSVTATNPTVGFTLLSQLLGKNGHRNFDKVTKTKTVSGIMGSLSAEGVQDFVVYLKGLINEPQAAASSEFDYKQVDARRTWVFDQLVSLVKNTTVPKNDVWVSAVLEFFVVHGLFTVKAANKKSPLAVLHTVPHPALSDAVHATSRARLSSVLNELSTESVLVKGADGKQKRAVGCDSTGTLWTTRALEMVAVLEKDKKHVSAATDEDEDVVAARKSAHAVIHTLDKVPATKREAARGLQLLIQSVVLQSYDDAEASVDVLEELESCATKMFAEKSKASKKKKAAAGQDEDEDDLAPIDILVDVLIGFLEKSSSQLRSLASQVFGVLSGEATESTIDLLLAQLESRPVTNEEDDHDGELIGEDEDEDMENDEEDDDAEESDDGEDSGLDEDEMDAEVDPELRKRIAEVLQVNGASAGADEDDESDDESEILMNDDEMMAMDEKLVEIFRLRTEEKKGRKDAQREATHFKNRVLELVETFLKKQPSSPLILRLVLPLLELVVHGSPNEAHLTSKVTGILQSRMFKAKEPFEIVDRAEAVELLNAVHTEARQASSTQTAKLCSQASIYVSRALLADRQASSSSATQQQDLAAPVVAAYTRSLDDFMTKKSTKVRASLFSDLAVRFPVVAWSLRQSLVQYAKSDGANSYRQTQAFNILNDLVSQLPTLSKAGLTDEIRAFVPDCRAAVYAILETAASPDAAKGLKADRLRDIVKFALKLVRASKAVLPAADDFAAAWAADSLPAIVDGLKQSDKLKSSKGLLSSVDQFAQIVRAAPVAGKGAKGKKAAKQAETKTVAAVEEPAVDSAIPTKRKKAAAPAAEDGVKKAKKKSKKSAE